MTSLIAQLVGIHLQCRRPWFDSWVGKICWRRDRLPTPVFLGFPCGSAGKESACNARDLGLIPRLGRFPWRRERLPTLVFWSGEFHGLYRPWGHKELDLTEQVSLMVQKIYILRDRCFKSCLLYVSYLLWLNPRVVCWGLTGKMGFYLTIIFYFKLIMFFQFCYFLLQTWS